MLDLKRPVLALAAFVFAAGSVSAMEKKSPAAETATLEDFQTAYKVEADAKARYEAFAVKADAEGYLGVAGLFRAAALSESVRIVRCAKAIETLGGVPAAGIKKIAVKSTRENLKTAIREAKKTNEKLYPVFIKKAQAGNNDSAVMFFKGSMTIEGGHVKLFSGALAKLQSWKAKKKFIVCRTCGYTTPDIDIKTCPVCSQPREQFAEVE